MKSETNINTPVFLGKGSNKKKKSREFSLTGGGANPNSLPILFFIL